MLYNENKCITPWLLQHLFIIIARGNFDYFRYIKYN